MITLGDSTTHRQVRDVLPSAIAWRDRLRSFQGPQLDFDSDRLLDGLSERQRSGISYAEITRRLNRSIRYFVEKAAQTQPRLPRHGQLHAGDLIRETPPGKPYVWAPVWDSGQIQELVERSSESHWGDRDEIIAVDSRPFPVGPWHMQAVQLLRPFRAENDEAWIQVLNAIRHVQRGEESFGADYPLDWDQVRGKIRKWREGPTGRSLDSSRAAMVDEIAGVAPTRRVSANPNRHSST